MKRLFCSVLSLCLLLSLTQPVYAETAKEESVARVENSYLKDLLEGQTILSSVNESEFLIAGFLSRNRKNFHDGDLLLLNQQLQNMTPGQLLAVTSAEYKNPTVALILSIFLGDLGIDRFYIGDIGLGVLKLVTLGGFGIWWLVDLFVIQQCTRNNNMSEFNEIAHESQLMLPSSGR